MITDSQERYEAGLPPVIRRVPLEKLTPEEAAAAVDDVEFYANEGPALMMGGLGYLIEDSGRARAALERRLEG